MSTNHRTFHDDCMEIAHGYLRRMIIPTFSTKLENSKFYIEEWGLSDDGTISGWSKILQMADELLAATTPANLLVAAQKWLDEVSDLQIEKSFRDEIGFFDEAYIILSQIFCALGRKDLAPYELDETPEQTLLTPETDMPTQSTSTAIEWELMQRAPGMVGKIANYIVSSAKVPQPMFALASALTTCGVLFGRKVRTSDDNRSNIFALMIGESGSGKNAPQTFPQSVAYSAGASELVAARITSDAAIEAALDEHPAILFSIDEIGHFLAGAKSGIKSGSSLSTVIDVLMDIGTKAHVVYSGKSYADRKQRHQIVVDQPCVCVLGSTTPTKFSKALDADDVDEGFLPRFLVFSAVRSKAVKTKERVEIPSDIVEYVRAWHGFKSDEAISSFKRCTPIVIRYTPQAERMLDAFCAFCEKQSEREDARKSRSMWRRADEMTRRIALVTATSRRSPNEISSNEITECDARWAIDLVKFLTVKTEALLEDTFCASFAEKQKRKLLKAIKSLGKNATPTQVTRKSQDLDRKKRLDYLADLVEAGLVEAVKNDKGRVIHYRA